MKTRILAVSVFAMMMISTAFANDIEVNQNVLNAFSEQFTKASEINWEKTNSYYKASFQFNGRYLTAFYSEDGEALGVKRNLLTVELPINLQVVLKNKYSDYWVTELCEYATNGESNYYIAVENGDQALVLHSSGTSDWSVFSRKSK